MDKELLAERLKDPKFYLESFTKIKTKSKGLQPFILKEAQKDLFNAIRQNSRVCILKSRQIGFCLSPNTLILTANLNWVKLDDIQIGQEIIAIDENNLDLHKSKKMRTAIVEDKFDVFEYAYKLKMEDGRELIATGDHKFLRTKGWNWTKGYKCHHMSTWKKVKNIKVGNYIKSIVKPRGELNHEDNWFARRVNRMYAMNEFFKIIGENRPFEIVKKEWWEGKALPMGEWFKVISIEPLGKKRMIDLQTSEKTYIANGFASHNSTAVTGFFYHDTITRPGITSALIGYNSDLTTEFLDKVKTFLRTTSVEFRPTVHYNSKYEVSFPRMDSKILVLPSTTTVGRGYTLQNTLLSELAFWDDAETKMNTIEASVPPDGKIVVESCVSGDTMVLTNKGPRYVSSLHNWKDNKLGFSKGKNIMIDGHYGLKPTNTYYNSGVQKGFKVTTRSGNKLKMSSVHKMFVLRGSKLEFVKASDIEVGDFLATKFGQNLWGNKDKIEWKASEYKRGSEWRKKFECKRITKDLAYLIGLIIGDGYVDFKRGRVIVTNIDKEVVDFLLSKPLGLNFCRKKDNIHFGLGNKSFVEFLSFLGMKQVKAPYKTIPEIIFTWKKELISNVLSGLFDSDGWCRKDRGEVGFCSTSKKMMNEVKILLLNFGILTKSYPYLTKPTKKVKVSSLTYRMELNNGNSNIFKKEIGFRINRKHNAIKEIERKSLIIPSIGNLMKDNMKELGLKFSDISNGLNKGFYSKSGNIRISTLKKIIDKCKNKNIKFFKELKELVSYGYFYDEVKKKEDIEEEVFDFTVNDGHTVCYNGLVGHQTPNGVGNLYHRLWVTDNNGYAKKEYGWWWNYTIEELDLIERRMNNPRLFSQEYLLEFLSSGRPVFDLHVIKEQRKNILKVGDKMVGEDNFVFEDNDRIRIYKKPKKGELFVCGVDSSEGVEGGDYSVVTIFNRKTGEEVAFLRELIAPDRLAEKLNRIGRYYNNALMVVEINGHGLTVLTVLKQLIYPSLYFRPNKIDTLGATTTDKMGWRTTTVTRPLMIDELGQALRDKVLTIHSKETLDEMIVFVYDDNNNMGPASKGYHDDSVFSTALALQGYKVLHSGPLTQINYIQHLPRSFAY